MRKSFERSDDTDRLVVTLRGVNGSIAYKQLAEQVGLSVRRTKTMLASARRILLNEKIAFGTINGFGIERLDDTGKSKQGGVHIAKIGRAAKRGIKHLEAVDHPELMSNADQLMHTTRRTILNAVRGQAMVPVTAKPMTDKPMIESDKLIQLINRKP